MSAKGWLLSMGLGAAVGAVAVMMLPQQSTARKLANQAADKVENVAHQLADKMMPETEM